MIHAHLISRTALLLIGLIATACQTHPSDPSVPALITDMTPEMQTRIESVLSEALNGRSVRISNQDFSDESVVIIEPPSVRSRAGMPIDGRSTEKPDHFDLTISGDKCRLTHRQTGKAYILDGVSCVAAS